MASLKEVKNRIVSVRRTKKVTDARQMVSSAHLRRAQGALAAANAFEVMLKGVAGRFSSCEWADSPLVAVRSAGDTAVVVVSSNSGMCGAFNTRMVKEIASMTAAANRDEKLVFYPVGKKIREALIVRCATVEGEFDNLSAHCSWAGCGTLADELTRAFLSGRFRRVEVVSHHSVGTGVQRITRRTLLPFPLRVADGPQGGGGADNFIVEPSTELFVETLIPAMIRSSLYTMLVDNQVAEHAARTVAMQLASENADELLNELNLTYNKLRQQNITKELLDIVGSSFA